MKSIATNGDQFWYFINILNKELTLRLAKIFMKEYYNYVW